MKKINYFTKTLLALTLLISAGICHSQTITTVAGNGINIYSGDGGAATAASLNTPWGLAVDGSGNIYIADEINNRIRKVNASTGIITTVAGNGTSAYSGDKGAAVSASLSYPTGVAIDGSGNIYIADESNNCIRKVNASTGIITTVAGNGTQGYSGDGGTATAASLGAPWGVAIDGSGNIYIADAGNNRIRKVNASTGIITTVAGNGTLGYSGDGGAATAASLYYPYGVTIDGTGNIYIADHYNNRIRKVNASTDIITTIAGSGTSAYTGDGGAATAASLNNPSGVAIDGSGNIYIADAVNNRIRKVNASTGIITTVAGNGIPAYSGDGGPATSASFLPTGVALDGSGNIYIADNYNNRIRKVNINLTGIVNNSIATGIQIYPNPASDRMKVTLPEKITGRLEVVNLFYQKVKIVNIESKETEIELSDIPIGFYLLQLNSSRETIIIGKISKVD